MRTLSIFPVLLVCLSSLALSATIHVPKDQPTIQLGLNAADSGDTVLVAPGTYMENISIKGRVILKSSHGPAVTIIDGNNNGSVVKAFSPSNPCAIDGFTITNGNAQTVGFVGGGINVTGRSEIKNCIIKNNKAVEGGGVYCFSESSVISGCKIFNNTAVDYGGGVACIHSARCDFANTLICNNQAQKGGGVYMHNDADSDFFNNTIAYNSASNSGGGFYVDTGSNYAYTKIYDSIIWGNSAPIGYGMTIDGGSSVQLFYSNWEGKSSVHEILGGAGGSIGVITADPLFVDPVNNDFRLQQDPCQPNIINPCVDSGSDDVIFLNLQHSSTRTDGVVDSGQADMGYHYGAYTHRTLRIPFYSSDEISAQNGGAVSFSLDPGAAFCKRQYLLLGNYTGVSPGTPLANGNVILPLNWDLFTNLVTAYVNTPAFYNFMGKLDSFSGYATAQFKIGPIPGAAGMNLYFAFIIGDPIDFASNPVLVKIVP